MDLLPQTPFQKTDESEMGTGDLSLTSSLWKKKVSETKAGSLQSNNFGASEKYILSSPMCNTWSVKKNYTKSGSYPIVDTQGNESIKT